MKTPKIFLTETPELLQGYQISNPAFITMPKEDIEEQEQDYLRTFINVGYNSVMFHRKTGTIILRKLDIKTVQDCIETDPYGILEDKFTVIKS